MHVRKEGMKKMRKTSTKRILRQNLDHDFFNGVNNINVFEKYTLFKTITTIHW